MSDFKQSRSYRKGFTLTEIAIVLGVIGVILGGIWMAAGQVNSKARVSQAIIELNLVTQNLSSLMQGGYGVGPNYACGAAGGGCKLTQTMNSMGVIPQQYWSKCSAASPPVCTEANSPWGASTFNIRWDADTPRTYRASFFNLPSKGECIALVSALINCTPGQAGCPIAVLSACSAQTLPTQGAVATTNLIQNLCSGNKYDNSSPCAAGYENADNLVYNNSVEFRYTQ